MDASIVIPVKNAGKKFKKVLEAVLRQKTQYSYEVICVDSGSTDGTLELIQQYPVRLFQILPQDFGHGRTRNYGAAQGKGKYIVFITHDALPVNDVWLEKLLEVMESDDRIAGAFGRHLPYPDCNIFDARDLYIHFERYGMVPRIFEIEDRKQYDADEGLRLFLAFFSDNNACLRRSVWEKIPYDDVNFAEDQIWAKKILELGYRKAYAPDAMVYHSHNFGAVEYGRRCFDDYRGNYVVHHGFKIVPSVRLAIRGFLGMSCHEMQYALQKEGLTFLTRLYWLWYAVARGFDRNIVGYFGSNYYEFPESIRRFLDHHVSQQYKQIRE